MVRRRGPGARYAAPAGSETVGHWLVFIDSGKWKAGVAVGRVTPGAAKAELVAAATVKIPKRGTWSAAVMARAVADYVRAVTSTVPWAPVVITCEMPVNYRKDPTAHDNIDELKAMLDATERALDATWAATPTPSEWKAQVPKAAHRRRIEAALTATEEAGLRMAYDTGIDAPEAHDMWDAIGGLLYITGRLGRGGVSA